MKIARWTIGNVNKSGLESLILSIKSFQLYHDDVRTILYHNCEKEYLENISYYLPDTVINQNIYKDHPIQPKGVAWKLYPPRFNNDCHELCVDNDIIFTDSIREINDFYNGSHTLLLEGASRNYGKFDRHVPQPYKINSGIYGMPPKFNLKKYIDFYVNSWENNAIGDNKESITFDEQGIVALALLSHKNFVIIPNTTLTNCEKKLYLSKGMHFIGVNRRKYHRPYQEFKSQLRKMFL